MVVPPKHPKMIRKTHGCWVSLFLETPIYARIEIVGWDWFPSHSQSLVFFCQNYIFKEGGFLLSTILNLRKKGRNLGGKPCVIWTLQKNNKQILCHPPHSQVLGCADESVSTCHGGGAGCQPLGVVKLEEPWIPSNTPLEQPLEIFQ